MSRQASTGRALCCGQQAERGGGGGRDTIATIATNTGSSSSLVQNMERRCSVFQPEVKHKELSPDTDTDPGHVARGT